MKKKQLFSLRKLTVGIASVSLGTVVFLSGAQAVDAQANAQDATTITQNAYNVVNNLPNISDQTKDAYIAKITAAAGNNKLTDVEGIVNNAKAEDAQVATAKKVAAEQDAKAVNQQVELAKKVAIETAKKDHAQKIANAKAEIYKLENLSNFTKARYSAKITKAATDEIAGLVQNAKAEDAKIAASKNPAKEQAANEKAKADAAAKDKAVKALNQKTADAYQVINSLKNITDKQQLSFLHQVEVDSGTNNGERIDAIVADAKQLDAQFAYDKEQKAKAEQKAVRELNTLTQVAYNTVNNLPNLTDAQKDDFNHQILVDSGNNNGQKINDIVAAAKQKDAESAQAKHVREAAANTNLPADVAKKVKAAHNTVEALKNLKPEQKAAAHRKLNEVARTNAKAIDTVVAQAKELNANQAPGNNERAKQKIETAQKAHAQRIANAQAEVNRLKNISKNTKAEYNEKISRAATDEIPALVKEVKALDAAKQPAIAKKEIAAAQKAHADQIKESQALVNKLENLSKDAKDEYNSRIAKAATNEVEAILNDAQAEDTHAATAKKEITAAKNAHEAEIAQAQAAAKQTIATAQKAHAQLIADAQALVNNLENLSKDAKDEYNSRIAKAATDEVEAIVNEAQAEDAHAATAKKEITTAQKAHAKQIADAQALVNKLDKLSKDAKAGYNQQIAQAATDEVAAIVKEAQAENAKQAPAKKEVKPAQKATTTPGQASKAGQNNKAVTAQKDGKTTATTNKAATPNKAAAQQQAKNAKKQLPATGEQDQVLFGLLSGSLFASAGTLFLLNARRRKENE
ncbi:YSIRK-type signal peptide-containing protein [Staphylococcus simulans]|uniref:YSIRK-type signal peptide-containing protein n=1 Tax=Staphylococcus simulans TaxID=1286 RepID=UPI000D1FB789|nr:YSIRK-type signal peptide-containing protein [Staphylococcus simulans]MDY5060961.1 YSIRK-type signal peptide-containing protein [Staphylococcus simulans]PTJ17218.1 hypothetical protein BU038_06020 [Staphylococcus simulans]